jgi:hypothetical protein
MATSFKVAFLREVVVGVRQLGQRARRHHHLSSAARSCDLW